MTHEQLKIMHELTVPLWPNFTAPKALIRQIAKYANSEKVGVARSEDGTPSLSRQARRGRRIFSALQFSTTKTGRSPSMGRQSMGKAVRRRPFPLTIPGFWASRTYRGPTLTIPDG